MPAIFLIAAILMTMLALSFVLKPLGGTGRRVTFVALAIALPIFAGGTYLALGSPAVASASPLASTVEAGGNAAAPGTPPAAGSIPSLVDGLAARLEKNPEDGKGWLLLAKSYEHLNRLDDARDAYARAAALGEVDASLEYVSAGDAAEPVSEAMAGAVVAGSVDLSPPIAVASGAPVQLIIE